MLMKQCFTEYFTQLEIFLRKSFIASSSELASGQLEEYETERQHCTLVTERKHVRKCSLAAY